VQADRPFQLACGPRGALYQCGARGPLVPPPREAKPRIIGELASASADEQAAVTFTAYFMLGVGQVGATIGLSGLKWSASRRAAGVVRRGDGSRCTPGGCGSLD
jgi:hypothetical protein